MDSNSEFPVKTPARVWWLCGFLFLATVLNYLDRQVLALTAELIIEEFQLTKEELGGVIAAFRYSYAIFQIAGGWMVDFWGARMIYPAAVGLWSLAGVLTGFARSVSMLSGFRFMLGIGEAFNWPSALAITRRLLPARDRALANGIFNSGAAAGAMVAPLIVTFIAVYYNWRWAFVMVGSLGAIWVVGWLIFSRPFRYRLEGSRQPLSSLLGVIRGILLIRAFWMLSVSSVVVNGIYYFLADWIPLYLQTERGFSFAVGNTLSILVFISLEAGNILIGVFIKKLVESGMTVVSARKWALFVACLLMSSALIVGFIPSRYLAVGFLMLMGLGVASFLVIYLTLVQDVAPAHVGATAGLLGGLGNLAYGLVSPYIGRLADLEQTEYTFLIMGLLPWLAFCAVYFGVDLREEK